MNGVVIVVIPHDGCRCMVLIDRSFMLMFRLRWRVQRLLLSSRRFKVLLEMCEILCVCVCVLTE